MNRLLLLVYCSYCLLPGHFVEREAVHHSQVFKDCRPSLTLNCFPFETRKTNIADSMPRVRQCWKVFCNYCHCRTNYWDRESDVTIDLVAARSRRRRRWSVRSDLIRSTRTSPAYGWFLAIAARCSDVISHRKNTNRKERDKTTWKVRLQQCLVVDLCSWVPVFSLIFFSKRYRPYITLFASKKARYRKYKNWYFFKLESS